MNARVLVIDNFDSFTYNLVQAFRALGAAVDVYRNTEISVAQVNDLAPTHLVISPGPGHPASAGISIDMIRHFAGRVPVLGVCLGHQAIVAAFGGRIDTAMSLMHGKTSRIIHDGRGIFSGLPQNLVVGRYHSLCVDPDSLPPEFLISARSTDGEIMAVRHRSLDVEGVQFHPESILTPRGHKLLRTFVAKKVRAELHRRGNLDGDNHAQTLA